MQMNGHFVLKTLPCYHFVELCKYCPISQ